MNNLIKKKNIILNDYSKNKLFVTLHSSLINFYNNVVKVQAQNLSTNLFLDEIYATIAQPKPILNQTEVDIIENYNVLFREIINDDNLNAFDFLKDNLFKQFNINTINNLNIISNDTIFEELSTVSLIYNTDYNFNFNLRSNKYNIFSFVEKYKEIILHIFKDSLLTQFYFINAVKRLPKYKNLFELIKIIQNDINLTRNRKEILDIYLEEYENCPFSSNDLLNYIYILRKFPLFRYLMQNYLIQNYEFKDPIKYLDEKFEFKIFSSITLSNVSFTVHNFKMLLNQNYSIKNYFFNFKSLKVDEDFVSDLKLRFRNYINLNRQADYGIKINNNLISLDEIVVCKKLFIIDDENDNFELISTIFFYYCILNKIDIPLLSLEETQTMCTNFFLNLFIIYSQILQLETIITNKNYLWVYTTYFQKLTNNLPFYDSKETKLKSIIIFFSIIFFKDLSRYKNFQYDISMLSNIINFFHTFSTNYKDLYPLIVFLSCSNPNLKIVIANKNRDDVLNFLIDEYDRLIPNPTQIYAHN